MSGILDAGLVFNPKHQTGVMSESDAYELCVTSGWRDKDGEGSPQHAVGVITAESSLRIDATSSNPAGGTNIGLFQIWSGNVSHPQNLLDPVYNANVARRKFIADGHTFKVSWETDAKNKVTDSTLHGPKSEAINAGIPDSLTGGFSSLVGGLGTIISAITSKDFWQNAGKVVLGGLL